MNDSNPKTLNVRTQHFLRVGISVLVIVVIIGSVMVLDKKEKERELDFSYARATVGWQDESNITIYLHNKSCIYDIKITGIDTKTNHEVELFNNTIVGKDNVSFYIDNMVKDGMDIWVEIENVTFEIKEKQKWM